ncbi:MAG: dicarboxylate/amino acid:cation symporter [Holosporales bacterium]|jgi:Na+/H+-dicarboxylate symporter|nr:dicarboxylate/amino acid:cation symporter [Holosporales bacterium]
MKFFQRFLNLPFFVLLLFLVIFTIGDNLDVNTKANLYAISLLLKDVIVFVLPFVIFSFVLNGIINLEGQSLKIILILCPMVCLSNFCGFWVAYIFTNPLLKIGAIQISQLNSQTVLEKAWSVNIPQFVRNDFAMIAGVCVGLLGNCCCTKSIKKMSLFLSKIANILLKKGICYVLPLFVCGFVVKMQHEGSLVLIAKEYSLLLAIVAFLAYGYMFIVMSIAASGNVLAKFKNLIPGVLVGLCSMSSAAAIPLTIKGSEKNLQNPNMARFVVPATANMHLLGDCFAIPIIGLALMVSFGYTLPSFADYFVFSLYGVVAKFAAAGIPGGSALIFVPIFEQVFGFDPVMLTAMTTIYVLFDPIATSSNVFGHGMFAILFERVYNRAFRGETIKA